MELEMISEPILRTPLYNNLLLIVTVLIDGALVPDSLFDGVWILLVSGFRLKKSIDKYLKDALLLTFSGVKGTVSIATILLIPTHLEAEYPSSLVLVAGVTLCSFLIGLLVLPKTIREQRGTQ